MKSNQEAFNEDLCNMTVTANSSGFINAGIYGYYGHRCYCCCYCFGGIHMLLLSHGQKRNSLRLDNDCDDARDFNVIRTVINQNHG